MHDDARFRMKLFDRHPPFAGRILQENVPHLRSKNPQSIVVGCDRGAAGRGDGAAERRITVKLFNDRHGDYANFVPVGVEFLGQDQRQRGHRPLTHLGRGGHDRDGGAVGRNGHPGAQAHAIGISGQFGGVRDAASIECNREGQPGDAGHDLATRDNGKQPINPVRRHGSTLSGRSFDRADDARIGSTATNVRTHMRYDLIARWMWTLL